MAASNFETDKMEKLYPGLNIQPGVVDKSGAIDDSLLTTVAGSAMLGIENYKAIETKKGLQEASALASQDYDEYASRSASGRTALELERDELNNMLTDSEGVVRNDILNRVDAITARLAKGQAQGMVSPYEDSVRSRVGVNQLANKYSWMAPDIVRQYGNTTNQLGLDDLYAQDMKAAEAQQKLAMEEYKNKVEFIQPFVSYDAYDLSPDKLEVVYSAYKAKSAQYERAKFILENNEGLSKLDAYQIWKQAGGTANIKEMLNTEIYQGLQAIIIDNERYPDFTAKQTAARELINGYETAVTSMYDELPQDKEDVKNFRATMSATFELMRKDMDADLSLDGLEKYKKNVNSIVKADLDTKFMIQFGSTENMQKSINDLADTLSKLKTAGALNAELETELIKYIETYAKAVANPKTNSYNATEIDIINDPSWGMVVEQSVRKLTTESDPGNINLVTATLNNINGQHFNDKSATNLTSYDLQLTGLSNLKPEVFKHIYNNQDFRSSIITSMGRYREYTMAVFQRESANVDYEIELDKDTGRLISKTPLVPGSKMEGNLVRANTYIKLRALMEGADQVKIAERIVKDELNNLEPRNVNPS